MSVTGEPRRVHPRSLAARAAGVGTIVVAILLAGCSTNEESADVLTGPCLDFAPSASPTSASVVARKGAGSTCDLLEIDFVITDVQDVSSVSFDVSYDHGVASLQDVSQDGSFLGSGLNIQLLTENVAKGELQVGAGRIDLTGVDATGTQHVLTLTFQRVASSGSGSLTVSNGVILGSGNPPVPKSGITWGGGTTFVLLL